VQEKLKLAKDLLIKMKAKEFGVMAYFIMAKAKIGIPGEEVPSLGTGCFWGTRWRSPLDDR